RNLNPSRGVGKEAQRTAALELGVRKVRACHYSIVLSSFSASLCYLCADAVLSLVHDLQFLGEVGNCALHALFEINLRLPAEYAPRLGDVGFALLGIVYRQRLD